MIESLSTFYHNVIAYPTVFFTVLLGLSLLYWLMSIFGGGGMDVDIDVPDMDVDVDVESGNNQVETGLVLGILMKLGLNGVPLTISFTLISLIGWVICYVLAALVSSLWATSEFLQLVIGAGLFLIALFIAVVITAQIVKVLRPVFKEAAQQSRKYIVGQTATVRSSVVNKEFGEISMEDGGAGLILKARSSDETIYRKGDQVVILERIDGGDIYSVMSKDSLLKQAGDIFEDLKV